MWICRCHTRTHTPTHTHPLTHIHTPTHTFCFFTLSRVPDTYIQGTHWCSHWGHSARNLNIEVAVLLCTSRLAAQEKLSHSSAYIQRALKRRGGRPSRRPHVQRVLQFHPSRRQQPPELSVFCCRRPALPRHSEPCHWHCWLTGYWAQDLHHIQAVVP